MRGMCLAGGMDPGKPVIIVCDVSGSDRRDASHPSPFTWRIIGGGDVFPTCLLGGGIHPGNRRPTNKLAGHGRIMLHKPIALRATSRVIRLVSNLKGRSQPVNSDLTVETDTNRPR